MLALKPKQLTVLEAVRDPKIHTIVLIGSVGTGKTDIAAHIGISIAYQFPQTYWTVFRQSISTAKRSVIPSYLTMLERMNLFEREDYKYNRQDFEIRFLHNQSKIAFIDADITKDREGRKIKGINATASHVDEADELAQLMFINAVSRRGRRNEKGQPSITIITMNPNDTHLKKLYYDPWKAGTLPSGVAVVEFTIEDSWQSQQDIEVMLTNPRPWVERYIKNNWSYQDDDGSLFKYRYFDASIVQLLDNNARRTAGYDVARTGSDRSVVALWYGRTLVDIRVVKDKNEQMKTDEQALELIRFMTQESVVASDIAVDGVGVGVGVLDHAHSKGIEFTTFISGAKPTDSRYDNLRSQVIFEFSQGLEKGTIKIYEGCPFRNELISESMAHLHKTTDKLLSVESKDDVKKRTGGLSPDIMDAVVMGLLPQLEINPNNNSDRIDF